MTMLLIGVAALLLTGTVLVWLIQRRKGSGAGETEPVSIERRLGPTRSPMTPNDRVGQTLDLHTIRPVHGPGPVQELPPDPWGLNPDKSVAPFLGPSHKDQPSREEEDPPQAAQQP